MEFDKVLSEIFVAAYNEAKLGKHEYFSPEHILYASLYFKEGRSLINSCGGDSDKLKSELENYIKENIDIIEQGEPLQTIGMQNVISSAGEHVLSSGRNVIKLGDIIVAIYDEEESFGSYFLKNQGIKRLDILKYITHGVSVVAEFDFEDEDYEEIEQEDAIGLYYEEENSIEDIDADNEGQKRKTSREFLENFSTELTEKARSGEIDPLIGRDKILRRTLQVLCRRLKNNPVHVGDPGVGKTAITEGLAQLIVENKVPKALQGSKIYSLDMGSMLAGTKYRGDFEERIKKVLKEIKKQEKAIVYIDEIHTVVGAGSISGGAMDASNILKPFLSEGKLKFIGSTTYEEYKKHFEKDSALSRRFQKIEVPEPTVEDTFEILKGLKERYEEFHNVIYTEKALKSAAELSAKYINDRFLPDKAIDLIDEAGAYVKLNYEELQSDQQKKNIQKNIVEKINDDKIEEVEKNIDKIEDGNRIKITEREIEKIISSIAKIPEQSVSTNEIEKLKDLDKNLKNKIFGQNEAIDIITRAIKRSRAGFNDEDKTVANLLLVGPTGVGKTELSRQLAKEFGIPLVRFDMSEYQEKHTVARLIGAPPGYVGYEEGGLLTDAIRKTPHCVLLLDEIEKVHQDILNILLQLMDYATLTDNNGKKADFRNVILIMTSNAGAKNVGKTMMGFGERNLGGEAITKEVERVFSPEFRNRLDDTVVFNAINKDMALLIAKKAIEEFAKKLLRKNIELKVTDNCYEWLAEKGFSTAYGAREILRVVQQEVKPYFVDKVLFGELAHGGTAVIDIKDDKIVIQ